MIERKRDELFRALSAVSSPVRIQVELTRKCNLKCRHCMLGCGPHKSGELPYDAFVQLIPEMRKAGVFHINLTGGEFFTHSSADDILDLLISSDFLITIQTNGVMLNDERIMKISSVSHKFRCVAISLYGSRPEVHESVTGIPGSFEATLMNIQKLVRAGVRTEVSTLLMSLNIEDRAGVESLCETLGVNHQFYTIILPGDDGNQEPLKLRLSGDEMKQIPRPWETFMSDYAEIDPADFCLDKSLDAWCTMGRTNGYITSEGDVLPCSIVNMPAGNILETPFSQIWQHSEIMKLVRGYRIGDFECSSCGEFPKCRPCPGMGLFEHGNIYSAPKEICRIIKVFSGEEESDNGSNEKEPLKAAGKA